MKMHVRIERLVAGGEGFGRLPDGRKAFVPGALPGDRVRVLETKEAKGWVRAERWELVEPGPERVTPPCPVADRCGGCDWMGLSREAELRAKSGLLREALVRIGGFRDLPAEIPMNTAGGDLGYRSRLRLHVDREGRIGLFSPRSHELVEIPGCSVCVPEINEALATLRRVGARHQGALQAFSSIEIRAAPSGPPVVLHVSLLATSFEGRLLADVLKELRDHFSVSVEGSTERSLEPQRFPLVPGVELNAGARTFTQVNWAVNRALVGALVSGALERGVRTFCDLYSGAGNFALALGAAGLAGVAIDSCEESIALGKSAAKAAGLRGLEFVAEDALEEIRALARARQSFDLFILDPPRRGANDVLEDLSRLSPPWVAYCSCDPVTLARDLKTLTQFRYLLESVQGYDMFPHTHHVEALAWLRSA